MLLTMINCIWHSFNKASEKRILFVICKCIISSNICRYQIMIFEHKNTSRFSYSLFLRQAQNNSTVVTSINIHSMYRDQSSYYTQTCQKEQNNTQLFTTNFNSLTYTNPNVVFPSPPPKPHNSITPTLVCEANCKEFQSDQPIFSNRRGNWLQRLRKELSKTYIILASLAQPPLQLHRITWELYHQ